jgi:SAM-dependent methyltransferase
MAANPFVNPKLKLENIDRYAIRKSIFDAINGNLDFFCGDLLDVGCGKMPYKSFLKENSRIDSYTGIDIETAIVYDAHVKPDLYWDGQNLPLPDASHQTVLLTEVLEHCPEPKTVLDEVFRVLAGSGHLFLTVPFLWPLHEVPHDAYRYTPFTLERLLKQSGFSQINIQPYGGWHLSMAAMLGLWYKRGLSNALLKKILGMPVFYLVRLLIKKDKKPQTFSEGQMCLGFCVTAVK